MLKFSHWVWLSHKFFHESFIFPLTRLFFVNYGTFFLLYLLSLAHTSQPRKIFNIRTYNMYVHDLQFLLRAKKIIFYCRNDAYIYSISNESFTKKSHINKLMVWCVYAANYHQCNNCKRMTEKKRKITQKSKQIENLLTYFWQGDKSCKLKWIFQKVKD